MWTVGRIKSCRTLMVAASAHKCLCTSMRASILHRTRTRFACYCPCQDIGTVNNRSTCMHEGRMGAAYACARVNHKTVTPCQEHVRIVIGTDSGRGRLSLVQLQPMMGSLSSCECTYIYIYIHMYTYSHTYTYVYVYVHMCMHVYVYTSVYIYIYKHICVYVRLYIYTYMYECIQVSRYTD